MIKLSNGHNQNNGNQDETDTETETENGNKQNLELLPYKKNVSFKWEKLKFGNKFELLTDCIVFNLWDNNFELRKNLHLNENLEIHYKHDEDCVYFKLKIENINGTIERGKLGRMRYFRPTSLIQTGLIYDIFSEIEDKLCEKLNINFLDIIDRQGLIRVTCEQRLPLNKVIYFKDLIVIFDRVEEVTCRGKKKYCIVCNIISSDVLLQN